MPETAAQESPAQPALERRITLLQATALNMANMLGVGPFITIPLLMTAMAGPQALLGWVAALLITIPDSMVWSELGAMMPGSGGSYVYLRDGFGSRTFGRLMAFLFIWQFMLSGPLEIASGYIGFRNYAAYLWPGLSGHSAQLLIVALGLLNIALLYRRITSIGKLAVLLWAGAIITTLAVIITGALHFNPSRAFGFPPQLVPPNSSLLFSLGAAAQFGVYDFLGYYDVCYVGEEIRNPGRVIPRSILTSLFAVAAIYIGINLSIIGVVPWREFVPAESSPIATHIASIFMERIWGRPIAMVFTVMVLWTALASVFALLLGYSRIPFAAANDGYFFRVFGRVHPSRRFPHVSLVAVGLIAIACSFISLDIVISVLLATRVLVQFMAQAAAVMALRKREPNRERPYRIWLYPYSVYLALAGWSFLFITSGWSDIRLGLGSLAMGVAAYFVWQRVARRGNETRA